MDFRVSVIIPVYNAGPFIRQAVESALAQPETAEVVLVEDNSPDDSLAACQKLAREYPQVRLFQHPGGINRGAGPSRNLGIINSTRDFIAFLDADDFYLPGRFTVVRQVFAERPDCDGVYEAVGMHFEDEEGKTRWLESDMAGIRMTTMEPGIPPGELYAALTRGGQGHIHLNGLVIRREVLGRSGVFNESIPNTRGEDTDFILRLSAVGQLLPGSVEKPTSLRRVHAQNRVSAPRSAESIQRDRMRLRAATYAWVREHGTPIQRDLAFRRLLRQHLSWPEIHSARQRFFRLAGFLFRFPHALTEKSYWRECKDSLSALIRGANGGGRG
ncbi:MAG TPA: glycosyltransferase family 2 protein [Anaerolineaceae bacterium]|jgi:hypothetical protein|nr:glycosyltransferase family 2 protein [Anaerolineaceae bacterium]